MHLTFDDGPTDYNTGKILDILQEEKVKATFFVQAEKLVNDRGEQINGSLRRVSGISNYYYYLLERMKNEGHAIGSHTFKHLHHVTDSIDWKANIAKSNPDILQEYYQSQGIARMRLPYGQGWFEQRDNFKAREIMNFLEEQGFVHVGWNIDSGDWHYDELQMNSEGESLTFDSEREQNTHFIKGIMEQICYHGGGIVLMHDHKDITWKNLRCLIQGLRRAGHSLVDIDSFIGFERKWGPPLIGKLDADQNQYCGQCFNNSFSTISPEDEEALLKIIEHLSKPSY